MDKLREEGIEFSDRFEAMDISFGLVKKEGTPAKLGNLTIG